MLWKDAEDAPQWSLRRGDDPPQWEYSSHTDRQAMASRIQHALDTWPSLLWAQYEGCAHRTSDEALPMPRCLACIYLLTSRPAATGLRTGHHRVPLKCHVQMVSDYGLSGSNAGAAAGGQALWSRPCQGKGAASGSRSCCPPAAPSTLLFLLESTYPGVQDAHMRKAEECLSVLRTRELKSGSTQKQDHDEENGSGVSWFV